MMTDKLTNAVRTEFFNIDNPIIDLSTVSSDVQIVESADGRTSIELFADSVETREQARLANIVAMGSTITVEIDKQKRGLRQLFSFQSGGIDVLLKLPKSASVNMKAVSADINVEVALVNLDIVNVSGDVLITHNPSSHCKVKTVSGDISSHTYSGCDYSLRSVSGDIAVRLAPGLDIEVDGKSVSGDMSSEIAFDGDSGADSQSIGAVTISATTVSGDFTLARN